MKRILLLPFLFLFCSEVIAAPREIAKVQISGNRRIEAAAIQAMIRTKPGSILEPAKLRDDIRRIFGMGYFKDVRSYYDDKTSTLTYWVAEKTIIREIKFEGNKEIDTEDLQKEVQTKTFSYYDDNRIREDIERLNKLYDGKGYYLADISTETEKMGEGEIRLKYKIREDRRVRLRRLTFIGNKVFSDKELKAIIQTKEKGFLSFLTDSGSYREEMFAQDRQILRDWYGHHGYIKAKIGNPRVQLSPDKRSLSLTVTIEEGDPYTVSEVGLDGEFIKARSELMKEVSLKEGKTADTFLIQQDISKLTTIYADEGYAYVNVIPRDSYDEEKKTVSIVYFLQPGQKVYIEKIRMTGNSHTRDKVLRREIPLREGDLFNATKIREARQNLERLSIFEKINISTPRSSADDRVDLLVDVTEKSTGTFSIGAGFNTLESFQIIGQVDKRNLFGYGVDISLQARVGTKTQAYNLRYRDEYFLDSKFGLTINAFNVNRRYPDFDQKSLGGTLGFDYPFYRKGLERIRGGITYGLINENLSNLRPTVEHLFTDGLTSSITLNFSRDTRNRVFEPSAGSYLSVTEQIAGGPIGGDNDFSKSDFDASWFYPVADESHAPVIGGSVFALHFTTGFVAPIKNDERVPLFERYFPGGITSIRGFELRSLGPKIQVASDNDPSSFTTTDFNVGGNKQVIMNAEYIFPIIRPANIKGVFFFDMGNAFNNGESMLTLTGQRQSTGFGIRWFSPIGPLRFEWGFPLDKKEDESTVVFDFTIGSLF